MMDSVRRLMNFLGLKDDEYGEFGVSERFRDAEPAREPEPLRPLVTPQERPRVVARPVTQPLRDRPTGTPAPIRPSTPHSQGVSAFSFERDVSLFRPRSYHDMQGIKALLQSNKAVILLTDQLDGTAARRCIDFAAGLIYGLEGSIAKLGTGKNCLLTMKGMSLPPAAVERMHQRF